MTDVPQGHRRLLVGGSVGVRCQHTVATWPISYHKCGRLLPSTCRHLQGDSFVHSACKWQRVGSHLHMQ